MNIKSRVYEALALHGPLAAFAVADIINIPKRKAFSAMEALRRHGAICISMSCMPINPDDRYRRRVHTYRIVDAQHPPLRQRDFYANTDHKIKVTDADERWMQYHRDVAAARAARKAAINEVRGRV